jgi:methylenetetrahydrofolate dehydrogenase (NADP+)/methenyltetrahydrofolate cyclohydrolase
MAIIFNGRRWAASEEEILKDKVRDLKQNYNIVPRLATILIGNDPASKLYVNLKKIAAERVGCKLDIFFFEKISSKDLISKIRALNKNKKTHGIMIQMPLPNSLQKSKSKIISAISPQKDVDGLRNDSPFFHPTAKAVIEIAEGCIPQINAPKSKLTFCVVGARGMVGKPLVKKLKGLGFKTIACHSQTRDLKHQTLKADILISAAGVPNLIAVDMVKKDAYVIDVGSPKGDVDFNAVSRKAKFITPVPCGVGPVTISCLLENLIFAAYNTPTTHTRGSSS